MKKRMTRSRRRVRAERRQPVSSITAAIVAASWLTPTAFAEAAIDAPAIDAVPENGKIRSGQVDFYFDDPLNAKGGRDVEIDQATPNVAIDRSSEASISRRLDWACG